MLKKREWFELQSFESCCWPRLSMDPKLFGMHSLRAGGATAAANAGVPDRLFKRHGVGYQSLLRMAMLRILWSGGSQCLKAWAYRHLFFVGYTCVCVPVLCYLYAMCVL